MNIITDAVREIIDEGYKEEWKQEDVKRFKWWGLIKDMMNVMEKEKELRGDYNKLKRQMNKMKALHREKKRLQEALEWYKSGAESCLTRLNYISQELENTLK